MDNFLLAVNAVMPFIIYMGIGMILVRLHYATEEFLNRLNSMVFKAFFPFIMFRNFAEMDVSGGVAFDYVIFTLCALAILVTVLFLVIGKTELIRQRNQRSVLIQALFRSNMILFALPLAESVAGEAGTQAASMLVAIVVPIFNVLAVIVLESFNGEKSSALMLVKKIITNPLILGAAAGVILLLLPFDLPSFIRKPVNAVADMTTPLSLIILGGTLKFNSVKKHIKLITVTLALKLAVIPAAVLLILQLFSFTAAQNFAVFAVFATPVAVSSYTMAANMGGDADLAGELVAFSTVASLFTIFIWILVIV